MDVFNIFIRLCIYQIQFLIFYNQNNFTHGKPIIGSNIRQATANEFPYIVSIMNILKEELDVTRDLVCSGTMISQEDILTAAHCFNNVEHSNNFLIIVGSNSLLLGDRYYLSWWITYDQWAVQTKRPIEHVENDLAITRLTVAIPPNVVPVSISNLPRSELVGETVTILGWGLTNENKVSTNLQVTTTTVISNTDCECRIYNITKELTDLEDIFMCSVAEPYALLNYGDSGGPLIHSNSIIAINKGTTPFRKSGKINVNEINAHISIESYANFILHVMYYY